MSNPLQTKLRLLFTAAGQDVSQSVLPDLLSFTFSDKETGEADELRLTLKDETGKWAATWKPEGGEVVDAYLSTGSVKRQPDGPTNRHKNDPLVRVGYLLQETA